MKAVGGFFRGARLARGLKPEQVSLAMADVLGENVSVATIYKIEGGRVNPGLDLVLAMLRVLHVDPAPMLEVARSEETEAQGEAAGRQAVEQGDALDWVRSLSTEERERMRRLIEDNPG